MAPRNAAPTETETGFADWLKSKTEDELKKLYPLTVSLLQGWEGAERPFLRVVSAIAGFRRGGIAHVQGEATHDLAGFKPDQIEQILAEPNLTVDLVPAPQEDTTDKPAGTASA